MDKEYWKRIYMQQNEEHQPSLFAKHIAETYGVESRKLIELGCGNGRDSIFFARMGADVTAIDQCENAVTFMQPLIGKGIWFECRDFTKMSDYSSLFDIVYSRFTLHSISAQEEKQVVEWAHRNLENGGLFCIEVRGQKNEIYRLGEPVDSEPDAFVYNNHYRRFLNFDSFCEELRNHGFEIVYAAEQKGFAPYNGTDETYIRVIAQK